MTGDSYTAAIVTFRRPESLLAVLQSIAEQSPAPGLTVVADNDPARTAKPVVEALRGGWPGALEYVEVGENLGPAGGWSTAVDVARVRDDRGEWVVLVDDDDPLGSSGLAGVLLDDPAWADERVGGIGLRGARLNRRLARLRRVEPAEGTSARVDYLAGNGAPTYRWKAIDDIGFFQADLFFGFEDLEYGLRLGQAGWQLRVAPHPSLHHVEDTASSRSAWREYYKTRSLVWILRRHVGLMALLWMLCRSVLLGGMILSTRQKDVKLALARWAGAVDGWAGRLGVRRYVPTVNPPKSSRGGG